ncbi:glycosyltransferase family 2 protein [Mucilaginibacter sp. HMF5004]|uniref:glycosyltransferase family 2 protein n=1 Tax=Mucilaginibacter rivuli TaxID=2857527 RepID=UPI001C5DE53C|nr:glycosyltransferase family 2 protein [Mucilaginibacter rivuli]MBW4889884.1 glycosyltransferase family 2 protein [Mucilaginibacter rivuli]
MAKLGLVTVLYNSNDVLEDFFYSLSIQKMDDYHLYLIDNSPSEKTDKIIAQLTAKYPTVNKFTHLKNEGNNGVAKGNNQGIQMALAHGADFVLLLNNDIYFTQTNILMDMVECSIKNNEHLIVPKIFYYNTRIIWMAGGDILKYKGYTSHYGENCADDDKYSREAHFNYAPTCFMLISKEVFKNVGLMDEQYFVYYDDTDFIVRCLEKGYKVFLMPMLEVFHKVAVSTGGGDSVFTIYYQNRNRIYYIKKNFPYHVQLPALLYTLITRVGRYLLYNSEQRNALLKGIKEGFDMEISNKLL